MCCVEVRRLWDDVCERMGVYVCVRVCVSRIGIGFSANGMMAGPANALSNAVICSPANGTVGQFDFVNATFEGIVPDNTAGTTGLSFTQTGGQTVLYFSRKANNGNPNDAQISLTGSTYVMWAIGKTNGEWVRYAARCRVCGVCGVCGVMGCCIAWLRVCCVGGEAVVLCLVRCVFAFFLRSGGRWQ